MSHHRSLATLAIAGLGAAPGCAQDPVYIDPLVQVEVDPANMTTQGTASLDLPISSEKLALREDDRAALETELGVMVPEVRLDDMDVSIEWSIKNLSDSDGIARIQVNGGNEWVYFDPQAFVIDPDNDNPPPPLMGDIPLQVGAGETLTGVFREDQLFEAGIDLELMSRGGYNPIAAVLQVNEDTTEITDVNGGNVIPREAFAGMVRFDFVFLANTHMVFEFAVRVRDHANLLHDDLDSAPAGELTVFAPAMIEPPPPAT